MNRALVISVRFHDDRYHGTGDWPPSPARLFQALVAAAALPGIDDKKREALKWLEELDAPTIAAPAAHSGQNVNLFVPNNDLDAKGGDIRRIGEIRSATKRVRPRLFDATVPLLYLWRFDGDESPANCICDIANGLYQLGRGVDMAWAVGELIDEARAEEQLSDYPGAVYRPSQGGTGSALDCPCTDSLKSLIVRHGANAQRFTRVNGKTQFANAPKPRFRAVAYNSPTTHLLFELRRTTAPGAPFAPWPLKSAAVLVRTLRDSACTKLEPHLGSGMVEKVLIGRNATEADKTQRISIIPLPSIGHVHTDSGIRRVLVEVPPDCPIRTDDVAWGFAGLEVTAPGLDEETGEILSSPVELVKTNDDSMLAHYGVTGNGPARLWRSVTPLALPEDAKRRRIDPAKLREEAKSGKERADEQQHACHAVMQALRHADRREKVASVRVQREPFRAKGDRAETFAAGTRFSKHQLWHVEIEFAEGVSGPLLLSNGRYGGLGVMAPVHKAEGTFAFSIIDGLTTGAKPFELTRALRRAVMARVQGTLGKRVGLPVFFTGHEPSGEPARRGYRSHLAYVFDAASQRLLVLAPHLLEHRNTNSKERAHIETLASALIGLHELRAGTAGKLSLAHSVIEPDIDPVFALSKAWHTQTAYRPTRHPKSVPPERAIAADVRVELERRHFPSPSSVQVTSLSKGPQGGLHANISLTFAVAVKGPILIGQTSNLGGGLFVAGRVEAI